MWTDKWPTEPGLFWLFGWMCEYSAKTNPPKLLYVECWRCGSEEKPWLTFVCHGTFLYEKEGAKGLWQPISIPELPTLEMMTPFTEEKGNTK